MAKKNIFDPEVIVPKIQSRFSVTKNWVKGAVAKRKKLVIGLIVIIVAFVSIGWVRGKNLSAKKDNVKTVITAVDKSFDFPALNNQGKAIPNAKIKFKVAKAEKTNQVIVVDKSYVAKNDKIYLIVHLELKNDTTAPVNIFPGDLIRLSYDGDDNKFAPDLHNNLVAISALSTRLDRIGFVAPASIKEFKLFIGELEGKKETVTVSFPS